MNNNFFKKLYEAFNKRKNNYVFWIAIFSFIAKFMKFAFDIELDGDWNVFVNSFLDLLIACGIVNDPTSGKGISDTDENK